MKREFDKTERRRRNQIKRSNKAILEKGFLTCFVSFSAISFFCFVFFFVLLSLKFKLLFISLSLSYCLLSNILYTM